MNQLKQTVHESQARLCCTSIKLYIHEISDPTTKYKSKNDLKNPYILTVISLYNRFVHHH